MIKHIRPALALFLLMTLLLGGVYPALVTLVAHTFFPQQANGSLIFKNGKVLGSHLIGQNFSDPKYFWGRPSATRPFAYNAALSSASNLSPANPALIKAVKDRIEQLKTADPDNTLPIPVDLVTASGSGLDPHISPAAAMYQLHRVAKLRQMTDEDLLVLVAEHTEKRFFGFIGEERVNVLTLNLALDTP